MKMSKQFEQDQNANQGDRQKRFNRVLGICLAYLLVVLFVLIPTTLSAYVSTTSGNDSVRVAQISMDSDITLEVAAMKPGDTLELPFVLSGAASDVTQEYSITVAYTGNLPVTYSLSGTANRGGVPITVEKLQSQTTYSDGILLYGETHTYTLTLYWDETRTSHQYADEIDYITITTQSVQVD